MAIRRGFIDSPASTLNRRRLLAGALGSGVAFACASRLFAAADFWNAKDPSAWTEEEISILTSKSPWAKAAVPSTKGLDPTGTSDTGRGGRGFRISVQTVIVRWESGQPILDALHAPLAADFDGHYVVSVTNLPIETVRRPGRGNDAGPDDALDRLQNGATLQVKSKGPAEAGIARRTRIGSILFGFSKDYVRVAPGDREILFRLDTGQLTLQAKFDPKEMNYRGKLAL
jgi:hypothetical protein